MIEENFHQQLRDIIPQIKEARINVFKSESSLKKVFWIELCRAKDEGERSYNAQKSKAEATDEYHEAIKQLDTVKKELSKKLIDQHKGAFRTPSVKCHLTQTRGRVNYSKLVKDQDIPFHVVEEYRAEGDSRIYTKLTEQENDS